MELGTVRSQILADIQRLWGLSRSGFRDSMLEVGRKIHEYVVTTLREGEGMSRLKRLEARLTRICAIKDMAAHLQCGQSRVSELIRVAKTVDLLSDGGDTGDMSYSSLRWFRLFVERGAEGAQFGRKATVEQLINAETWCLRPKHEWGVALFRQAAREGWTEKRCRQEVMCKVKPDERKRLDNYRGRQPGKDDGLGESTEDFAEVIRNGSPKDVADILYGMIQAAHDPVGLCSALKRKLDTLVLLSKREVARV